MSKPSHSGPSADPREPSPSRESPRFRETTLASGVLDERTIVACEQSVDRQLGAAARDDRKRWDAAVAECLVGQGTLTRFQAEQLLKGRKKLTLGHYLILDEIGRGGMGQVFQARDCKSGRIVAIKVLPRKKSTEESEEAFKREIRMLSRLDHDNLVRALGDGYDGKVYYLVTEWMPDSLDLRQQILQYGPLDERRAASVIAQAAQGLGYAHDAQIVHRDMKPANLLVTSDGMVKVLDLGLADSTVEGEESQLRRVVGTLDFMAPEQVQSVNGVSKLADIYALGCTLYFAITGEVPFPGGTRQEKAQRHLREEPRPIQQLEPDVSDSFCRVVESMMRKDPGKRPQSATAVIALLKPWIPPSPLPMPRTKQVRPSRPQSPSEADELPQWHPMPLVPGNSEGGRDSSRATNHSTRGLLSESEETDRANELQPDAEPLPTDTGWAWVLARSVGVAAVVAVVVVSVVRMATGVGGTPVAGIPSREAIAVIGWAVFGLLVAVQLIMALGREPH